MSPVMIGRSDNNGRARLGSHVPHFVEGIGIWGGAAVVSLLDEMRRPENAWNLVAEEHVMLKIPDTGTKRPPFPFVWRGDKHSGMKR
jgi:hypothetical protein